MLIKIFRSGYIIKIVIFLIVSFLLWLPAFIFPEPMIGTSTFGIAYDALPGILMLSDRFIVLLSFLLLLIQAVIFNAVLVENPLFSRSVFLPALIYVILMSYNPSFLTLHPALVANLFLILSLKNLYSTYSKNEAFRESFNASFWVALASLFHLPAILMVGVIWAAFFIFRINSWREWLISFIGLTTPYLLIVMGMYLFDELDFLKNYYPDDFAWIWIKTEISLMDYVFWPAFILLISVAFFKFTIERMDKIISIRKSFSVVNTLLIITVLSLFFSGINPYHHVYLIFPASSVIIAYYFIETKRHIYAELLFILLLLSIVIVKFI